MVKTAICSLGVLERTERILRSARDLQLSTTKWVRFGNLAVGRNRMLLRYRRWSPGARPPKYCGFSLLGPMNGLATIARWVRRGKLAAWGPGIEDWEVRRTVVRPVTTELTLCADRRTSPKAGKASAGLDARPRCTHHLTSPSVANPSAHRAISRSNHAASLVHFSRIG